MAVAQKLAPAERISKKIFDEINCNAIDYAELSCSCTYAVVYVGRQLLFSSMKA